MVCDERNDRVQVFELSGKFVTKFGSKGVARGETLGIQCPHNETAESSCLIIWIMNDTILTLLQLT